MFRDKPQEDFNTNIVRQAKINRKNNRVFILQYSPERTLSKKKNQWEKKDNEDKKLTNYILKKQMLREQNQQRVTSPAHTEISHRSNIDRLINLISKSRTNNKNNDSGCEKMVRALIKVNTKLGTYVIMKEALESLKKYTMTCSSHNYQLFLQSRHLNFKQTHKLPEGSRDKNSTEYQQSLQKIAQYAQEYLVKNEHSGLSISKELNNDNWKKQLVKYDEVSFNNRKLESADYLTTRQELLSQQFLRSPKKDSKVEPAKCIELKLSQRCSIINIDLSRLQALILKQKVPSPLLEIQKDRIIFPYSQKQQTQLTINQLKTQIEKCSLKKASPNFQKKKSNSPILSLMFAIPTDINEPKDKKQINSMKLIQNFNQKEPQKQPKENRPAIIKNQYKKQQVLTPNQYAQLMLFGTTDIPQTAEQKVSKQYRNFLQQKSRKRVSSLPKITFTYVSRQKYQAQNKMVQKNPIATNTLKNNPFPMMKQSISKNSSKQELHSTFQSKQAVSKPRQNVIMNQSPNEYQQNIKNSNSRQKLVVMHQPFGSSKVIRNEYYGGDAYQINRQMPQTLQMKRQRILTAQPSWQKEVQFVGVQQQLPGCCWQQKEVRSRSMNDRILVRTNSQNNIVFR